MAHSAHHVAHHVPGRLRLKLPTRMRDAESIRRYAEHIRAQPGVLEVSTNSKCGSVVIRYDPKATSSRDLLATMAASNGVTPTLGLSSQGENPLNGHGNERPSPANGTVHQAAQKAAQTFGLAVGHALFNAAFKFSVEQSVSTLLRRR